MDPQVRERLINLINNHIEFVSRSFEDPDTDFQQLAAYNDSFLTTVHYDTEWNEIIKKFLGESVSTESYAVIKTNEQLRNNIRSALLAYLNKLVITIRQQEGGMVAKGIVPVKEDLDRWGQEAEAARAKQVEQRTHIRQWREKWVGLLREQESSIQERAQTELAKVRADLPSYITSNPAPIIGAMIVGARDIAQAPKSEQLQVEKAAQKRVQAQVEQQALSMGLPRSAARAAKGNTAIFTAMTMLHQSAKEDLAEVPGTDEFNERVERLTEASGRVHSTVAAHVLDAALQVANDRQRAQIESFIHRLHYDGTLDQTYQEASLSQRKQLETFVRAVELDPATAGQLNLFYLSDTRTLLDVAREFEAQHQPTLAQFKPPEFAVLPLLTADKVRAAFDFKPGTSKIGDELIMSTANYLVGRDALLAKFGYDRTQAEKLLGAYLSRSDLKARFDSLVKMYGYDAALKEVYASSLSRGANGPEFMSRLGELKTRFISRLEELGIQLPRQVSQGFFGEGLPASLAARKEAVPATPAGGPLTAGTAPSLTPFWRSLRNLGGRIPFFQQLGWSRLITFMSSAFPGLGRFFGSAATPTGNMVARSLGDLGGALGGGVRNALARQAARRVAQGIGQTGARALISRLIPSWVVVLIIGAVVFIFSTGFTFPTAEFTEFMRPAGGGRAAIPVSIASGSCPITEPHRIIRGTYNTPQGHGTDYYWEQVVRQPKYSFPIPDAHLYTSCNSPQDCGGHPEYYGLAIDVVANSGSLAEVRVPYVCPTSGGCVDPEITWNVFDTYDTSVGTGVFLEAQANGHNWKIFLHHLVYNGRGTYSTAAGNNVVGTLDPRAGPPHAHFELTMDGIPVDPTPFCPGISVAPGLGGQCQVPADGYCSLNDPATNLQQVFGSEANNAAQVCYAESGGYPAALNKGCLTTCADCYPEYSVGLFQINMLAHTPPGILPAGKSCQDAFVLTNGINQGSRCEADPTNPQKPRIVDRATFDACWNYLTDPRSNTSYAKSLYDGRGWNPWTAARKCGIVGGSSPGPSSGYVLQGELSFNNIIISTSSEFTPLDFSCSWVGNKGLLGGTNASYFKSDGTPVGWAGYGLGDVRDYGAGTSPPTLTFQIDTSGAARIVPYVSGTVNNNLRMAVSGTGTQSTPGIHHRTALGIVGNKIVLVVLPSASSSQLENALSSLGVTSAIQLDGGGSSAFCSGGTPLFGNTRRVPVNIGLRTGTMSTITVN